MKKKIILTSISILLVLTTIIVYTNKKENTSLKDNNTKQVVEENTLSMMIEQTAGAGDYKLETRSSWPTSGYVFNTTLSKCENGGKLSWDDSKKTVVMMGAGADKCYVYFDKKIPTFVEYIVGLYTTQGVNGLYHHDGSLENGISDGSYRYAGESSSVNNYVCFGSTADTCPDDNKYRIIGVFDDQVKLIKADYANSNLLGTDGDSNSSYTFTKSSYSGYIGSFDTVNRYYWNYSSGSSSTNIWSASRLNTVNLTTNFINNIGTTWSTKLLTQHGKSQETKGLT